MDAISLLKADQRLKTSFSCLGAKAALNGGDYRLGSYGPMNDPAVTQGVARDLFAFTMEIDERHSEFSTFAAAFPALETSNEEAFETALWALLQSLHHLDGAYSTWDANANEDPGDPHFSFSFAGHAFFVVGMHPGASRWARRFPAPLLVFNSWCSIRNRSSTPCGETAGSRVFERRSGNAMCGCRAPSIRIWPTLEEPRKLASTQDAPPTIHGGVRSRHAGDRSDKRAPDNCGSVRKRPPAWS